MHTLQNKSDEWLLCKNLQGLQCLFITHLIQIEPNEHILSNAKIKLSFIRDVGMRMNSIYITENIAPYIKDNKLSRPISIPFPTGEWDRILIKIKSKTYLKVSIDYQTI